MNFTVNQDVCIGCGACAGTCPEVFELVDNTSCVKVAPVPGECQERALAAEAGCPVSAITHT